MRLDDVVHQQQQEDDEGQEQQGGPATGKTTFIWMILATMKKSFYNIDVSNPVNPKAADM